MTQRGTEEGLTGRRYAVVGGGISGLASAWFLQRRGAVTTLFERERSLGGRTGSARLGERVVTLGGKNIGRGYGRFREFTRSLGNHPYEHFGINSSRVRDGKLVVFDSTARGRTLRQLRGMPARDVARLARLAVTVRRDPSVRYLSEGTGGRLAWRYRDRSVEQAFGPRLCDLLLRPLTVRVSAAEPDEVPMANVLPYVGMVLDSYEQLSGGMHEVVEAAGARSRVCLGTEVRGLLYERGCVRGLRTATAAGDIVEERFDGVVVAIPAHAAANLVEGALPRLAPELARVRYFPVTVALAEYSRSVFAGRVRAIVFGPDGPLSNAGAYGVNDLNVVRYTFSGRRARSLAAREPDPERLAALGEAALAPFAAVAGNRRRALLARYMSPGLCAYHPDQPAFLRQFAATAATLPGLSLTGDYLRGCSIEACFAAAEEAVAAIPAGGRERD